MIEWGQASVTRELNIPQLQATDGPCFVAKVLGLAIEGKLNSGNLGVSVHSRGSVFVKRGNAVGAREVELEVEVRGAVANERS